ncbi:hypothetical protein AtubIFM57258_003492 [Aspergillus tubingensis]|nr:hypothetical protein AtubIFM57258_003492 [Aspergillus tubingensis]
MALHMGVESSHWGSTTPSPSMSVLRYSRRDILMDKSSALQLRPNIAEAKASENSISEERNKPGAMTKEKGTEKLDSADRGLTADLVFQGVAFEQFGSMTPTFVHSNLAIAGGSFVASADASRGGKSTINSLLEPFDKTIGGPSSSGDAKTPYQAGI